MILLDVKLRTSPLLEMIRTWTWGTAETKAVWGILAPAPSRAHARTCTSRSGLWVFGRGERVTSKWGLSRQDQQLPRLEPKNWGTFKRINWYKTHNNPPITPPPPPPPACFPRWTQMWSGSAGSPKKKNETAVQVEGMPSKQVAGKDIHSTGVGGAGGRSAQLNPNRRSSQQKETGVYSKRTSFNLI